MQFQFSFKHMPVSDSLKSYCEKKLEEKVLRYATKPDEVRVSFSKVRHLHHVHISVKAGDGFDIESEHTSEDMYASVDFISDKLQTQLRKQKEKIKSHHPQKKGRFGKNFDPHKDPLSGYDHLEIDAADILKFEDFRKRRIAS